MNNENVIDTFFRSWRQEVAAASELVTAVQHAAFDPIGTEDEHHAWLDWVLNILTRKRNMPPSEHPTSNTEYEVAIKKIAFDPIGTHEENIEWLKWVLQVLTDERYARTWSPEAALAECNTRAANPPPGKTEELLEWKTELELLATGHTWLAQLLADSIEERELELLGESPPTGDVS